MRQQFSRATRASRSLAGVRRSANELTGFGQDRWVVNPKLTIDAGLRFDRDGLTWQNNFAPRISFLFLPLKDDRTIIRGGIGLFYDRTGFGLASLRNCRSASSPDSRPMD